MPHEPIVSLNNYVDLHPTKFDYRQNVARNVKELWKLYPGLIYLCTYHGHPPLPTEATWDGKETRDLDSFDVWGPGYRGSPLDPDLGDEIFWRLRRDPRRPNIAWIIWKRRIYGPWNNWRGEPFGHGPFTWHDDHIHVTYEPSRLRIVRVLPPGQKPVATKPPVKEPIWGVDISSHQDTISLARIKQEGYDYAFIKATEGPYPDGTAYTNPYYKRQMAGAVQSKMVPGAYHFLVETPAKRQVDHFLRVVGNVRGKAVIIDYEAYPDRRYAHLDPTMRTLEQFVHELRRRIGAKHPIIVYSGQGYWNSPPANGSIKHLNVVTWDAYYPNDHRSDLGSTLYREVAHLGWGNRWGGQEPMFWQFSRRGKVAGRQIDVNAFRGTRKQLEALTGVPTPAPRPPKPPDNKEDEPVSEKPEKTPCQEALERCRRNKDRLERKLELAETRADELEETNEHLKLTVSELRRELENCAPPVPSLPPVTVPPNIEFPPDGIGEDDDTSPLPGVPPQDGGEDLPEEDPAFYEKAMKAIVAAAILLLVSLGSWYTTGEYNREEIALQILALLEGLSVYFIRNRG